ncbi:MAG: glycosyl hydrolase family 28-related protein [Armatimonadota bacterium]
MRIHILQSICLTVCLMSSAFGADDGVRFGMYSVIDYGAKGNGITDDTPAFQRALDAAQKTGGTVVVPPVASKKGYVLTRTVRIPHGVTLMGHPAGLSNSTWPSSPNRDALLTGARILARPAPDQYNQPKKNPLFLLEGGCTVRGLWIIYDKQPFPTDQEFQDPKSRFYYKTFDDAKKSFIAKYVKPYGPTFYIPNHTVNAVVEDISCDRFYDFFFQARGGKSFVRRICLYGYKRAFVFGECLDVNRVSEVHCVPNVGTVAPGIMGPNQTYTWVYGIIASQDDNIGVQIGRSDGYILNDVFFFGVHTALRLGASVGYPIHDPVTNTDSYYDPAADKLSGFGNSYIAQGPWGDIYNLAVEACAVGVHLVWPSPQTIKMVNTRISTGIDDGRDFPSIAGTGNIKDTGKQAMFVVEPTYSAKNNINLIPTVICTNAFLGSFTDDSRFGPPGANAEKSNGRVFLIDGDITMDITGFLVNYPYSREMLCARGKNADRVSVKIRGFIQTGNPSPDTELNGASVYP